MEINDFIQHFAEQFDDTDASVFKPETEFRQLEEWDSIKALAIILMVDEEYSINITGDDLKTCETINDVFQLVNSK